MQINVASMINLVMQLLIMEPVEPADLILVAWIWGISSEIFLAAEEAVDALHKEGYFVYSIEQVEGSTKLQTLSLDSAKKYAVVLGNEVKGVHQSVVDMSDGCLEIPQFGTKHSLNVSVTAGIVVWEFARLRMKNNQ